MRDSNAVRQRISSYFLVLNFDFYKLLYTVCDYYSALLCVLGSVWRLYAHLSGAARQPVFAERSVQLWLRSCSVFLSVDGELQQPDRIERRRLRLWSRSGQLFAEHRRTAVPGRHDDTVWTERPVLRRRRRRGNSGGEREKAVTIHGAI